MLPFREARARAVATARGVIVPGRVEAVALADAAGRVLADDAVADRDQPPFHRSTRDGFALRAAALPGTFRVVGEIAAGSALGRPLGAGEAAEIMTGAPLPDGADAVVMVEHVERAGAEVRVARTLAPGENVVAAGSELGAGARALARGTRVGAGEVAILAALGYGRVRVAARPRVAVLATGDELVEVTTAPGPTQIRNSNAPMLAAQIARAGGAALVLPPAPDREHALRALVEQALAEAEIVILSGGVSMGKHDLVEKVLADLGARFEWDAVAIRPGKPAVFGVVRDRPFFGLPGNPLSAHVTFELFARPVIEVAAGAEPAPPSWLRAPLAAEVRQPSLPLTVFAPARLEDGCLALVRSQGSGDLASLVRADGFAVIDPGVTALPAGTMVPFMPR